MQSESPSQKLTLTEFSPATPEQWRAAAEKLLKGAPFEKKMVSRTYEGIDLQPIYTAAATGSPVVDREMPGSPPFRRGVAVEGFLVRPWQVAQEIPYRTAAEANAALKSDLGRGQTSVYIPLDRATRLGFDADKADGQAIGDGGLSVSSIADLLTVLSGVDLALTPLHLEADLSSPAVLAMCVAVAEKSGVPADHLRGTIGADPLGLLLLHGSLPFGLATGFDRLHLAASWSAKHAPALRSIAVRSRVFHDAGADAVQELAYAIASGVEYVRALLQRGMTIDDAAQQVWFSLCSGTQFFMEVAKFRAARLLWATAIEAFGGSEAAQKLHLHVRTSAYALTAVDPYVNMLRGTTEAIAGGVGGCDSMHVGYFDEAVRLPDEFSRRIARNTQIILQEEAHLTRVIDPAGGSWYVESLTDEIAQRSWKLFQEIEAGGGMGSAILRGDIQERTNRVGAQRADGVARRKDPVVGVTAYANATEVPLEGRGEDLAMMRTRRADEVRAYRTQRDSSGSAAAVARIAVKLKEGPGALMAGLIDAARHEATVGELMRAIPLSPGDAPVHVVPLPPARLSSGFEALRAAMVAVARKQGHPLRVFLATMGPVVQHKARADFAAGFFAVAGCELIQQAGYSTAEEAAGAACDSEAEIVVLCSTDDAYPGIVAPFCAAVKNRRKDLTIVLAGFPQEHIEAFRTAGVEEFIHIRSNVLETLRSLLGKKGVRP
jgi:methylmalonyl-CoA mutase